MAWFVCCGEGGWVGLVWVVGRGGGMVVGDGIGLRSVAQVGVWSVLKGEGWHVAG